MPVRALVAAASPFAIEENSLRVALARLFAAGTVERDDRGEYRLGKRAQAVQQQVVSWKRLEERTRPWQGGWVGVHSGAWSRSEARRAERALRFFGFRELAPGLEVRPDNLVVELEGLRSELVSLGLPESSLVMKIGELEPSTEARARSLWDARKLLAEYHRSCAELAASEDRLPTLAVGAAMVESFVLGGRAIRQLVLDPLLPEPIIDVEERRKLGNAMRRYDKIGHACWRPFFAGYRVTSLRAPVDSKMPRDSAARVSP